MIPLRPSHPTRITEVTTDEFPSVVIGSNLPMVVDFWAPWCGPCRMLSPVLEELARDYAGRVGFAKVNVDKEAALASAFGVTGLPALIFYEAGSPREMITGWQSAAELRAWLTSHLKEPGD